MLIPEAIRNNAISGLIGAAIGWLVTQFQGKTARLRYSTRVDRIAITSNDPIFGSVAVTWGGNAVRNLYMAWVEVENATNRDFEDVPFMVYVGNDTFLLNERTGVVNTPYIVPLAPAFTAFIAVAPGTTPTPAQSARYYHCRDYVLPTFNRGQLIQFTYLCTRPNDDNQPEIFISTQLKGARLRHENRSTLVFGVPLRDAVVRGLVVSTAVVALCGYWFHR